MSSVLNLGILAHVDAGKTSLTERLLHATGVLDRPGRVDDGTTQTDTLALERQRGITIRSAVVSFGIGDRTVNLIDTPGHPDFIAEVERALAVLDGAVLVVSAVEGVQAQTRILLRALRRLAIPTLVFVNKVDRRGARGDDLLPVLADRLTTALVPVGTVRAPGTPAAKAIAHQHVPAACAAVLAEQDDALLADYVTAEAALTPARLRAALTAQARRGLVHPVFFGSAATGTGIPELLTGIHDLLPAATGDPAAPLAGTVFAVHRGPAGEKITYVRLFAGTLRVRDRLPQGRITAAEVFDRHGAAPADAVTAGRIGKLWGLADARVGDPIGTATRTAHRFPPPTLETVVVPAGGTDRTALHAALSRLAEQDPLIGLRTDDDELALSLYGEVQKEVIAATLAQEHGVTAEFRETTTLCLERVTGTGAAVEVIGVPPNPFPATVGLRVEPAPRGSGVRYARGVELGSMPHAFMRAVEETVHHTLRHGLAGWPVTDCVVTLVRCGYASPVSHAGHFRALTPLVLAAALRAAGTAVHEPVHRVRMEVPADAVPPVLAALARLGGVADAPEPRGADSVLHGAVPAARVVELHRALPSLTSGEGVLESAFECYRPVRGAVPRRAQPVGSPLNREEYLLSLTRRVGGH